jgi:hypothetical protein
MVRNSLSFQIGQHIEDLLVENFGSQLISIMPQSKNRSAVLSLVVTCPGTLMVFSF